MEVTAQLIFESWNKIKKFDQKVIMNIFSRASGK